MRTRILVVCLAMLCAAATLHATIFATVRGVVHDPQHRPVRGAAIILKSATSDWSQKAETNDDGEFEFATVPIGEYSVSVTQPGFDEIRKEVTVISGTAPVLHFQLTLAAVQQKETVSAQADATSQESVTPTTLMTRADISDTPGADRTNSLAAITDYVPGAYFVHDQLHIRGGHQVSWLVDGVPVANTNIASNVGPQFDPKDMDYLEVQRGSYDADYGDRTYGVFNVVPRTGFERNAECSIAATAGNFYQTNDYLSCGDHTNRLAYYASLNANRSNFGLETPVGKIIHDAENGFGGFGSLLFNVDSKNQLRLVVSARRDYYQIPNDPDQQASGIRDGQHEADSFVNFSWVHTFNPDTVVTISPFYHYNSANYEGGPNDFPISTTDERASNYAGGQATVAYTRSRNYLSAGVYGFAQHDNQLFGLIFNDGSSTNFRDREIASGSEVEEFIEDKFNVTRWFTVMAGVRETQFSGEITENATSPRFGTALRVPRLNWIFHAFYGHFYQAPPLLTVTGPVLDFVTSQNLGFIPLHGERDEESQFGVTIPYRGWTLDADTFKTRANNFFDHNNVGNSNIFFPLTIDGALIRGWELTVRSPRLFRRGQVHLAYSNQVALARGAISGGLTNFSPPSDFFALDHDQRNTLNVGFDANLPWRIFAAANVYYGSGFTNGNPPPAYLPGHSVVDLSLGKEFGEKFSASVNALNLANRHLLIDNSFTFGGFHFNDPRQLYVEVRYRFHY